MTTSKPRRLWTTEDIIILQDHSYERLRNQLHRLQIGTTDIDDDDTRVQSEAHVTQIKIPAAPPPLRDHNFLIHAAPPPLGDHNFLIHAAPPPLGDHNFLIHAAPPPLGDHNFLIHAAPPPLGDQNFLIYCSPDPQSPEDNERRRKENVDDESSCDHWLTSVPRRLSYHVRINRFDSKAKLEHHERYCDSRPVQCPLIEIEPSCRFLGTGKEMAEHLHKRHADILIKEQGCNVTWKLRRLDDYMNQMAESYCLQEAFQRSFLLQIKTDLHRNFHFAVFLAGRTMESMMSDGETLIVHPNLIKQFRDKKQQLPFQMRISNVLPNPYDSIPMPQRTESEETKEEAEHETEDDDDHTPRAQSPVPPEEERNEQITSTQPKVSTVGSFLTIAFRLAIRITPKANVTSSRRRRDSMLVSTPEEQVTSNGSIYFKYTRNLANKNVRPPSATFNG
ncbi:unnamed protein product [Cyprideis torosa]|uniref:SIAH-type domain-containing protein n=1 Tax=Cyprideis torosa TaxID=163714 RepID=A0A7R8ZK42_9CRUS|nr:unnamed protein product [Cyprideis torosa]CAG0883661.1 unnamed protein product [Cyprideis torosa]